MAEEKFLIISDGRPLLPELREILLADGGGVDDVSTIEEAIQIWIRKSYSLILVEMSQPKIEWIRKIQSNKPDASVPLLALTPNLEKHEKIELFYAGASMVLDAVSAEVCAAQIYALLRLLECAGGNCCNQHQKIAFGTELMIDPRHHLLTINGNPVVLTRKEFELLHCLASAPMQVFTFQQLFEAVWEEDSQSYGIGTVRTHIGTLRRKMGNTGLDCIDNIWGIGYRFIPPGFK